MHIFQHLEREKLEPPLNLLSTKASKKVFDSSFTTSLFKIGSHKLIGNIVESAKKLNKNVSLKN